MADVPTVISSSQPLMVRKVEEYHFDCPACGNAMLVTAIKTGTLIKCNKCNNITLRPDFVPPWWSKTSRFILSLLGAFLLGLFTNIISTLVTENPHFRNLTSQSNPPAVTPK